VGRWFPMHFPPYTKNLGSGLAPPADPTKTLNENFYPLVQARLAQASPRRTRLVLGGNFVKGTTRRGQQQRGRRG
jgi:hypothetical protein